MAIQDDFSVATNGDIRHVSGSTHYTVIQLHRWLGNLMDDAQAAGNDLLDITDATASERATDNLITLKSPYNIDDDAAKYLYDGSIVQKNGDEIYDGIVVIANAGMYLQILQNGGLIADNFWTTGYNADAANGVSHRMMIKVRTAAADIDGRRLIGTTRELGYTYSEFKINGTARGNNVMALNYASDLNNQTAEGTISGWTDIVNITEGYNLMDVDQNLSDEAYYSEWDKAGHTINQFYERMKWLTRRGTTSTLYGLDGDLFRGITHEITITTPRSGTWGTPEHELVEWSGGTGQLIAVDNKTGGSTTKMWIQLLTGVAPTNGQLISAASGGSGASGTCSGTPQDRTLSFPFCGVSTGSAIIGSYGFGMDAGDLTNIDKVFDLTDAPITPPNQKQFTVGGLSTANGGDRILVAPLAYSAQYDTEANGPFVRGNNISWTSPVGAGYISEVLDLGSTGFLKIRLTSGDPPIDNSAFTSGSTTASAVGAAVPCEDPRQLKLATTVNGAGVTQIVCTAAIPTDTPKPSGTIRIELDSGIYRRVPYTSYSGSTFTIDPTDFTDPNDATGGAAEAGNSIFVSYIDKNAGATSESATLVYAANRDLFVRVRFGDPSGPIKTFESGAQFTAAGGTATAIRTADA